MEVTINLTIPVTLIFLHLVWFCTEEKEGKISQDFNKDRNRDFEENKYSINQKNSFILYYMKLAATPLASRGSVFKGE